MARASNCFQEKGSIENFLSKVVTDNFVSGSHNQL